MEAILRSKKAGKDYRESVDFVDDDVIWFTPLRSVPVCQSRPGLSVLMSSVLKSSVLSPVSVPSQGCN